ncbi:TetR family transcriptional regulator [Cellulomonas soli]|uniref:TetR family transcriptional regulator n=1 Tax=Cellulomonas soli TaxID=931535 RepID=A0A512P9I8_9CELL|nr:TetR family transcriptional regulator [Cellulomonas soli]NYI60281.1 AcrR family transcriptional regulator [Cellulomonas soli]GEP67792.1 TetR family transcriptional regulator [Cellulomonas soli]
MIRREQAERTRELLLDAAAAELWLHGLGGTRIQDVLDRAQVTKGGLYHHFTSKQEMADALAAQEAGRWPALAEDVSSSGARGLSALEEFAVSAAQRLQDDIRAKAVLRIAEELEGSAAASVLAAWHDFTILSLQQAIADGEVGDSIAIREVAATVVEAVYGACVCPAPASVPVDGPVRVRRLWAVLAPGLRSTAG